MGTTEGAWSTGETTEDMNTTEEIDFNNSDSSSCKNNYIPTVDEYSEVMGAYQTALLAVGGFTAALLYLLFAIQVYHTLFHVEKRFRRHVLWLTSACPFMTLLSVLSVVVPRADTACTAFKVTYLSLSLSHFMDLTTEMFGNEKVMLAELSTDRFNLHVGPACYCCYCLPSPPVRRDLLRWVRWLLWQMPYTQAIYFMIQIIWSTAMSDSQGRLNPNSNMVWVIALSFVTIMAGIYGLQITTALCREKLSHYGYQRKSFAIKILVMASQLQTFIMEVLSLFKVFPCLSPHISPRVFKQTLRNTLYLPEMLVIGIYTWRVYWTRELETRNTKDQGVLPTTDPSRPRSSVASTDMGSNAMDKGSSTIPKIQFNDDASVPAHPRSSSSSRHSMDRGSDSLYNGLDATHDKIPFSNDAKSASTSSVSVIPVSDPSPPYPSSLFPPRPPRSLRSSSIAVPNYSSSTSPVSSYDHKNYRGSSESRVYSASPTSSSDAVI